MPALFDPLRTSLELTQKFNPNHDERGRFAAASDTSIMGSPNKTEHQSLGEALRQMSSHEMSSYIAGAKRFDNVYGLASHFEKGIGLWEGSMEATVIEHLHGKVDPQALAAAAAAQGKEQGQNAMATWVDDPAGEHMLTTIHLPRGIDATPQYLVDNGVPGATVTPGPNGTTKVSIISTTPNKEEMAHLAAKLGATEMEINHGHAEFIDKSDYDSVIGSYQRSRRQGQHGRKGDRGTYFAVEKAHAKRLGAFSFH